MDVTLVLIGRSASQRPTTTRGDKYGHKYGTEAMQLVRFMTRLLLDDPGLLYRSLHMARNTTSEHYLMHTLRAHLVDETVSCIVSSLIAATALESAYRAHAL